MDNARNIIIIMGDQHPFFMTGCYGDGFAKTPHLDEMSRTGVTFDCAYSPSPLCAPARACMMTGVHVSRNEVWDNAAPLRSDWPTFAHSFAAAGYRTVLCGKMHFVGPDQYHGFQERWTPDIYPAGFDWTYPSREGVYVPPEGRGQAAHRVHQSGMYRSQDMDYDDRVCTRALQGLRELSRGNREAPFLLCVSFAGPHYPFAAPEEYWGLFDDANIPMPDMPGDYQRYDPAYVKWFRDYAKLHDPVPPDVVRRARHAIYGRLKMLDDYVGGIMDVVRETGIEENTIVLYTSDHGDMMGQHGLWFKCTAYEGSCRVPMIFRGPGIPSHRVGATVNLVDLGPTLCALAGIEPIYPTSSIDGSDFSDLVLESAESSGEGSRSTMAEYYGDGTWKGWRMLRRGRYKLVYALDCQPVLFDLDADPGEWNDLAGDSRHREVLETMTAALLEGWDPAGCTERCWQSQERRQAVWKALKTGGTKVDWNLTDDMLRAASRAANDGSS